jgi:hypothetical protein
LVIASSVGAGLVLLIVVVGASALKHARSDASKPWKKDEIEATYIGCQIKEIDKTHTSLTLTYDLMNNSDTDYRLADGPDVIILSKLESNGSLSQEEPMRLSYPVFVPAGQHARMAIETTRSFAWPSESDPKYIDKLRDFVRQRLKDASEFVVFDEAEHRRLELPGAWQDLLAMRER